MNKKLKDRLALFGTGIGFSACFIAYQVHSDNADYEARQAASAPMDSAGVAQRLKTISSVTSVGLPSLDNGQVFVVTIKSGSMLAGADTAKDALHTISIHGKSTAYTAVQVIESFDFDDAYGNKSVEPIIKLTISRADVEKFNYANIAGINVLNLSDLTTLSPLAAQLVRDECEDGSLTYKAAPQFCTRLAETVTAGIAKDSY